MNKIQIVSFFLFCLVIFSCCQPQKGGEEIHFNEELSGELIKMAEIDQMAAWNAFPPEEYKHLTQDEWEIKKDSIYKNHKLRLEEILKIYGYPGFDLVGKEGEKNYWLMVQHSDFDPDFQRQVLELLEKQVEAGNADSRNFGLLTDRVRLNSGEKQVYGTQVTYVKETGQAIPKPLEDSLNVNKRRRTVGLETIEEYLNMMTEMHFEMNKENMLKRGITEPQLYKTEK